MTMPSTRPQPKHLSEPTPKLWPISISPVLREALQSYCHGVLPKKSNDTKTNFHLLFMMMLQLADMLFCMMLLGGHVGMQLLDCCLQLHDGCILGINDFLLLDSTILALR
jgi:hypothetical protein